MLETDTILTFNQTIEQVQARGERDLSRYPAVTELYDKANSLRPKLAMNLNDTGKKEGTPCLVTVACFVMVEAIDHGTTILDYFWVSKTNRSGLQPYYNTKYSSSKFLV